MVRLRMTPRRCSSILIAVGVVALTAGAWIVFLPAGLIVGGAALVLSGLFLVDGVEGARESLSARSKRPRH